MNTRTALLRRLLAGALFWALAAIGVASPAQCAELLMLEQPGCGWCQRWHAEIGPAYPNNEEGQRAPLRRIDITKPWPADIDGIRFDRLTPTFVLIEGGREVGRLRGYPGDEFFWVLLDEMLANLP
jgi:hypothetical protein